MRSYSELTTGWSGQALSEEERRNKQANAYATAATALRVAEMRLLGAIELLVFDLP